MSEQRVLLTGASGRLARRVHAQHDVGQTRLFVGRSATSADTTVLDITDPSAVKTVVSSFRPHAIIHLAAISGRAAEADPRTAEVVNVVATRALAEAAADAGVGRIVFASTAAVYGDDYREPVTEDSAPNGRSVYAETKLRAEAELSRVAENGGPQSVALRMFNIYGDGFDDSLLWKLARSTREAPVLLRGLDSFVRDYSDGDWMARALLVAVTAPLPAPSTILNVGTGVETSNRRLVELLRRQGEVFYEIEDAPPSYSCADVTAMRHVLGLEIPPLD
jgi:UDP-glucose 4-epimerase